MTSALQSINFNLQEDISYHFDQKLPLPIQTVYNLAAGDSSHQEFTHLLDEYVTAKTAKSVKLILGTLMVDLYRK